MILFYIYKVLLCDLPNFGRRLDQQSHTIQTATSRCIVEGQCPAAWSVAIVDAAQLGHVVRVQRVQMRMQSGLAGSRAAQRGSVKKNHAMLSLKNKIKCSCLIYIV